MKTLARTLTKKKDKNNYAGLQIRLIANLIDFLIVAILLLPLFAITSNFIYGDITPAQVLGEVGKQLEILTQNDPNFDKVSYFKNNQLLHDYFINKQGIVKMIIDNIIQVTFLCIVFVIFWVKKQATIGKRIFSLKIVDATTFEKPKTKQFIIRIFGIILSVVPLFLGIIWIAFDPKKQAWHDKLANTVVIKDKSK